MVWTRYKARLLRELGAGEDTDISTDSEVSFNPAWLDKAFLGRGHTDPRSESDLPSDNEQDMEDAHERRLQLLESTVMGMNQKFDMLLTLNREPPITTDNEPHAAHGQHARRPRVHSQPALSEGDVGSGGHIGSPARPRRIDPRAQPYADFVADQLRREEFTVPRQDDGRALASDMYIKTLIPKPYMYLDRPGLSTIKKKLDVRDTMSFNEYTVSFLKMVRDPRAAQNDLLDLHLEHLQQVIEDAGSRDWPSVRRWSQATFDKVENGALSWEDRYGMQIERMRHALLASSKPAGPGGYVDRRDLPCRDFNAHTGCMHPRAHQGRNVMFAHICASCFQVGERAPHSAVACPRKLPQHLGHTLPRFSNITAPQPPKNAQPASQQPMRTVRPPPIDLAQQ